MGECLEQYLICPDCAERMVITKETFKDYAFIMGTRAKWECKQCNIEVNETATIYPRTDSKYIVMFHKDCGPLRVDKVFSRAGARFRGGGVNWYCQKCHRMFMELLEICDDSDKE